jgi:hypothetical protein
MNLINLKTLTLFVFLFLSNCLENKANKKASTDIIMSPDLNPLTNSRVSEVDYIEDVGDDVEDNQIMDIYANNNILSATNIYTLNKKSNSCDVGVKERIKFKLQSPQNIIDHIIISKKTPLYGFTVFAITPGVLFNHFEIFQDSSFKERIFIDSSDRRLLFRDRWLVAVYLDKEVSEVELEFGYNMQRALSIDPNANVNYLNLNVINPYPSSINYDITLKLLNFQTINEDSLNVPYDTVIKSYKGGLDMEMQTQFDGHSEYDVTILLPMEIETCERGLVDLVYYGLIIMSFSFIVLSLITMYNLYKD